MSRRVLRGKGKPFPYSGADADLPHAGGIVATPAGDVEDAVPYKSHRPHPFPPPAGEGAAHKGGRRGRTRRDRNVEMTAVVEGMRT